MDEQKRHLTYRYYIYYTGSIWGKVDLIENNLDGIDIAINADYKSDVLISGRLRKAISDIGVKELKFRYIRPEPQIVEHQGCITKYIWPDTGEEYWVHGDPPLPPNPNIDRILRLVISWPQNKALSEIMLALKKTYIVFKNMPASQLLQLVKNCSYYDIGELQYYEALNISEIAKKNGLEVQMEEWIEVVSSSNRQVAQDMFNDWQVENEDSVKKLSSEDDVRIDFIRIGEGLERIRYMVRYKT